MSIIGTRPPLISETNLYELHHNLYDKNAVQVYDQREKLIGYVPRYYAEAFAAFIKEKRVKKGKILCVDKNRNCDGCIKIEVFVAGV